MQWRKGGREISSWYVLVDLSQTATCVWLASRLGVETVRVEMHLSVHASHSLDARLERSPCACAWCLCAFGAFFVCRRRQIGRCAGFVSEDRPLAVEKTTCSGNTISNNRRDGVANVCISLSRAKTPMSKMHADHWKETFTKLVFVGLLRGKPGCASRSWLRRDLPGTCFWIFVCTIQHTAHHARP